MFLTASSDLLFFGDSLPPEPAAFSVKTTPQTRNPKVTKPLSPAMSLTLQVTAVQLTALATLSLSFSLSFSSLTFPYTLFHRPSASCVPSLCAPTARDGLTPFLSVPLTHFWAFFKFFFKLFLHHSVSLHSVRQMCQHWSAWGARHGVIGNEGCAFTWKNPDIFVLCGITKCQISN